MLVSLKLQILLARNVFQMPRNNQTTPGSTYHSPYIRCSGTPRTLFILKHKRKNWHTVDCLNFQDLSTWHLDSLPQITVLWGDHRTTNLFGSIKQCTEWWTTSPDRSGVVLRPTLWVAVLNCVSPTHSTCFHSVAPGSLYFRFESHYL